METKYTQIPFGVKKDAELKGWEYTIPEGMEAIIKDGKVIVRVKENEDDKMRKAALKGIEYLERILGWDAIGDTDILDVKEYLEKQKDEQYVIDLSLEQEAYIMSEKFKEAEKEKDKFTALRFLQCLESFDKFREGEHYWLEYIGGDMYVGRSDNVLGEKFHITPRQLFTLFSDKLEEVQCPPQEEKQLSPRSESVLIKSPSNEEIIDALLHHLSEQDGILTAIDGVSTKAIMSYLEKQKEPENVSATTMIPSCWTEKQKEQKDYNKLYEDIGKSEWFKKSYEGKSLGCNSEQEEQKPVEPIEFSNEFENQVSHLLTSVLNGEHEYNEDFVRYVAQSLLGYAKKKLKNAEQKPAESISRLTVQGKGVYKICPRCKERMVRDDSKIYTSIPPKYGYECPKCGEMEFDTVMYDSPEMEEQKPAEWSEEDEEMLEDIKFSFTYNKGEMTDALIAQYNRFFDKIKSLKPRLKQEWSEEDKRKLNRIYEILGHAADDKGFLTSKRIIGDNEAIELQDFLKSLRPQQNSSPYPTKEVIFDYPHWKPTKVQMDALKEAAEYYFYIGRGATLRLLYNDLQKL